MGLLFLKQVKIGTVYAESSFWQDSDSAPLTRISNIDAKTIKPKLKPKLRLRSTSTSTGLPGEEPISRPEWRKYMYVDGVANRRIEDC